MGGEGGGGGTRSPPPRGRRGGRGTPTGARATTSSACSRAGSRSSTRSLRSLADLRAAARAHEADRLVVHAVRPFARQHRAAIRAVLRRVVGPRLVFGSGAWVGTVVGHGVLVPLDAPPLT